MSLPITLLTPGRALLSFGLLGAVSSSGKGGEYGRSGAGGECVLSAVSGEEASGLRICGGGDKVALGGEIRPVVEVRSAFVGEMRPALGGEMRPVVEMRSALVGEVRPVLGGELSALAGEMRPAPRRWRGVVEAGAASAGGCALFIPSIRLRRSVRRWTSSALSTGTSSVNTNSTRDPSAVATKRTSTHGHCGAVPGSDAQAKAGTGTDAGTEACAAGRVDRAGRAGGCALAAETGADETKGFERWLRG